VGTDAIGGFGGTGNVGHAGVEGDGSGFFDEFVGARVGSTVAGSGGSGSAVED